MFSGDVASHVAGSSEEPSDDRWLEAQEQADTDQPSGELDTKLRGLSLTPAPSVGNRKRKKGCTTKAAVPTPADQPCTNCRVTKRRKVGLNCVQVGPNGTCRPCQQRKLRCSKNGKYLLQCHCTLESLIQTLYSVGKPNKRRKAVKSGRNGRSTSSQSEDEDEDEDDCNTEDEDADNKWTHDDSDIERSGPASPSRPTSRLRGDREKEMKNATEARDDDDGENSQPSSPGLDLALASVPPTRSYGGPAGTFLGVILPAVRSSNISGTEPKASSSRVTLDGGAGGVHDSSKEDEEHAPRTGDRSITVRRSHLSLSAATPGRQATRGRASHQASTSEESKARQSGKPSQAIQRMARQPTEPSPVRASSPTFPADVPPTFGHSEAAHLLGPRPERYVPAELVLATGNVFRIVADLVSDVTLYEELQAIMDAFQLVAAYQLEGVVLSSQM